MATYSVGDLSRREILRMSAIAAQVSSQPSACLLKPCCGVHRARYLVRSIQ
jgi:hypothetical protein